MNRPGQDIATDPEERKQKILWLPVVVVSIGFIGLYIFTVANRLTYPYELEWMEGTMLTHSIRLLEGKSIFVPPSAEFIPYLYTPLYQLIVAGFMKIFGVHLWVGRLVSILASLANAYLLYKIVYKESSDIWAGIITSGFFLASYRFTGAWMDIVRVDTLQLPLLLFGFYILRYHTLTFVKLGLSAIFFSLAYFTKQSALIFIAAAGLVLFIEDRKKALFFLTISGLLIGGITLIANCLTDNWFGFYTLGVVRNNTRYTLGLGYFLYGFLMDLIYITPCFILLIIGWFIYQFKRLQQYKTPFFWELAFLAGFVSSMLMRSKMGGYANSYLGFCCFGSILVGIIVYKSHLAKLWLRSLIVIGLLSQFYLFAYNPFDQIPTQADYQAGDRVVRAIASFAGPVLVFSHSFYPIMVGKEMNVQDMPLQDLLDSEYPIPEDLANKIENHYYDAIILDKVKHQGERYNFLQQLMENKYYLAEELFEKGDRSFYPVTGYMVRPHYIYLPVKA